MIDSYSSLSPLSVSPPPQQQPDYVEEGDPNGEPLLLIHGFPDMWYGWRHQIRYLAKHGYRVIAPDCLGYGQTVRTTSTRTRLDLSYDVQVTPANSYCLLSSDSFSIQSNPHDADEYSLKKICAHLAGLLDALNIPKVTVCCLRHLDIGMTLDDQEIHFFVRHVPFPA